MDERNRINACFIRIGGRKMDRVDEIIYRR